VAEFDFGDAPDSYGTTLASNGARHPVAGAQPLFLGQCVDTETDAQVPLDASGDDSMAGTPTGSCANGDDEDGVSFGLGGFIACGFTVVTLTTSGAGRLDAWVDWNRDGDFTDAGERFPTNLTVSPGSNLLLIPNPCTLVAGPSFARFRLSSVGGLAPTGAAPDGEVEDYAINLSGVDFGDAPNSYETALASNGANHAAGSLYLGSCVDTESNAQSPFDSTGDDRALGLQTIGTCAVPGDDEDGVTIPPLVACEGATIQLVASDTMRLDAWIDWNRDGDFNDFVERSERIATRLTLVPGVNSLTISVPCSLTAGPSYARFRVSSNGVLSPGGSAGEAGGEVEDYVVNLSRGVVAVPALDSLGLALLAALLGAGAFAVLRRRRRT